MSMDQMNDIKPFTLYAINLAENRIFSHFPDFAKHSVDE